MVGKLGFFTLVFSLVLGIGSTASAQAIQVGPCDGSGTTFCGAHPNPLGSPSLLDLHLGGSSNEAVSSIFLILGVPIVNGSIAPLPNISGTSPTAGQLGGGGGGAYGATWNVLTGNAGTFSQPSSGTTTIYSVVKFNKPGDSSENSSNWFAPYTGSNSGGNLLGVNSFELFIYTLNASGLHGNDTFAVDFTGALPLGAIVTGYACSNSGPICWHGDVWSTPFTQSGLVDSRVPEPSSILLLGSGLLGFAGCLRRRLSH